MDIDSFTIKSKGRTHLRNRTLINFIIYFLEDTIFIKCAYAYDQVKCVDLLYELSILKAALENGVHITTDNATNYMAPLENC